MSKRKFQQDQGPYLCPAAGPRTVGLWSVTRVAWSKVVGSGQEMKVMRHVLLFLLNDVTPQFLCYLVFTIVLGTYNVRVKCDLRDVITEFV